MDLITAEHQPMVKIELEAAEALAGLARFPAGTSVSNGSESVAKDDCNSSNSYEEATNSMVKKPGNILSAKLVKDQQSTKLRLNQCYPANSGRKSRQNLTEAEIEARKIRRVLANRESARQTIRRRQAVFEELTKKAVDLAWENEKLKREKETASKQYDYLKTKNECLKAQMTKITTNNKSGQEESMSAANEPSSISTSSTNSPFVIYNQPSFLPLVLQCGSGNSGDPLYILPYPWLVSLPENNNENHHHHHHHPHSFNLNDQPKESSENNNNNGEQATESCCEELVNKVVPTVAGKRSCDTAAATEARKRRKELTRLKNNFHCRQLRMY